MLYDVSLKITYGYEAPVSGGRHLVRVLPASIPGRQRLVAGSVTCQPAPFERREGRDFFANHMPTVMTIHNIAFQGQFGASVFPELALPPDAFSTEFVEYYGDVGFLKGGLQTASAITTVSPSYAQEILTPEFGMPPVHSKALRPENATCSPPSAPAARAASSPAASASSIVACRSSVPLQAPTDRHSCA